MSLRSAILLLSLPFLAGAASASSRSTMSQPPGARVRQRPITWAPDGKRFAFREHNSIWQYDVRSEIKKEIVSLATLREKAVESHAEPGLRLAEPACLGSELSVVELRRQMLVATDGDLFLVPLAGSNGTRQLTATAEPERDPKLSPNGRSVAFRRGHDLYSLDIASLKETRLTHDGSPTLLNGRARLGVP